MGERRNQEFISNDYAFRKKNGAGDRDRVGAIQCVELHAPVEESSSIGHAEVGQDVETHLDRQVAGRIFEQIEESRVGAVFFIRFCLEFFWRVLVGRGSDMGGSWFVRRIILNYGERER